MAERHILLTSVVRVGMSRLKDFKVKERGSTKRTWRDTWNIILNITISTYNKDSYE
jgi:hypothetical protein